MIFCSHYHCCCWWSVWNQFYLLEHCRCRWDWNKESHWYRHVSFSVTWIPETLPVRELGLPPWILKRTVPWCHGRCESHHTKGNLSKFRGSVASVFVSTLTHNESFNTHVCIYVQKFVTCVDNRAMKHLNDLLKQVYHQPGMGLDSHEILWVNVL